MAGLMDRATGRRDVLGAYLLGLPLGLEVTLGFLIHHALGPGVQLLRLSRGVPDGGEAYSAGDGDDPGYHGEGRL